MRIFPANQKSWKDFKLSLFNPPHSPFLQTAPLHHRVLVSSMSLVFLLFFFYTGNVNPPLLTNRFGDASLAFSSLHHQERINKMLGFFLFFFYLSEVKSEKTEISLTQVIFLFCFYFSFFLYIKGRKKGEEKLPLSVFQKSGLRETTLISPFVSFLSVISTNKIKF